MNLWLMPPGGFCTSVKVDELDFKCQVFAVCHSVRSEESLLRSLGFWLADYGGDGYVVLLVVGVAGDVGGAEALE